MSKFEKAKKRALKRKSNNKWWVIKTKNYNIPIYLLPIAVFLITYYKLKELHYKSLSCNEEQCKKALDKMLPKMLRWSVEDNYYYVHIGKYWGCDFYKYISIGKKTWAKKCRRELKDYLIEKYENKDYTKHVIDDGEWWLITFTENNIIGD